MVIHNFFQVYPTYFFVVDIVVAIVNGIFFSTYLLNFFFIGGDYYLGCEHV